MMEQGLRTLLCHLPLHEQERKNSTGDSGKSNNLSNITRAPGTSTQGAITRAKSLKLTQIYMMSAVEHPEGIVTALVYDKNFLHEWENSFAFWGNSDLPHQTIAYYCHFFLKQSFYVYKTYLFMRLYSLREQSLSCPPCPQRV